MVSTNSTFSSTDNQSSTTNFKYFGTTAVDTTKLRLASNGLGNPQLQQLPDRCPQAAGRESDSLLVQMLVQPQDISQGQLLNNSSFFLHQSNVSAVLHQSNVSAVQQGNTSFPLYDINLNQHNISVTNDNIMLPDSVMFVEYSPDSGISADSPPPESSPFNIPSFI